MVEIVCVVVAYVAVAALAGFAGWFLRYTMCCNGDHCIDIKEDK